MIADIYPDLVTFFQGTKVTPEDILLEINKLTSVAISAEKDIGTITEYLWNSRDNVIVMAIISRLSLEAITIISEDVARFVEEMTPLSDAIN